MLHRSAMASNTNSSTPNNIAQALLRSGLSIDTLRALTPLEENAQKVIDQAVVDVGLERLVLVQDMLAAGLVYNLPNPLSVTEVQWDTIAKTGGAQRQMNPSARGEYQLPNRVPGRVPIYLTTDDFSLGIRTLLMSQRIGAPLDTTLVQQATRRVNEAIEDAAINGATVDGGVALQVDGYTAPGLLNAPNAQHQAFVDTQAWDNSGHDGTDIQTDILAMVSKLQAVNFFGPYNLYVPALYGVKLMTDFKANGDRSILSRIEEMVFGGRPLTVRIADRMPANTVVLVQMTSDVLDLIVGQQPTTIPWTSNDGFTLFWMVMAIIIPRFRSNIDGSSGIVIGTPSGS